jgi:hypothetical protein
LPGKPAPIDSAGRLPVWHPTEEQYQLIRDLAELGWPSPQVAEALQITPQQFAGGIIRHPRVKEEYEAGVAACKGFEEKRLAWRPLPQDIKDVRYYAAKGLKEVEIAAKLKVSRNSLTRRLADTPVLREALELGEGEYRASLIEDSDDLLKNRDPDLKNVSGLLIFKLKAHCGLNDKGPDVQKVQVEGKVEHTHKLNAPTPVPAVGLAEFAKNEMARATKISAQILPAQPEAVEAEVLP